MGASNNAANVLMNAAPWVGVGGGVAALAAIPHAEAKLFACALMSALAAGTAIHKYLFAAPAAEELGDYPFSTHNANPWERDGGPHGL